MPLKVVFSKKMKNLNKFKSKLIKGLDYFNDYFYPYLPPQLPSQEEIDKMPTLDELEAQVYQDTLDRIDPDGFYHYRCHPLPLAEKGERIPDLGDMALKQGCVIGAVALRIKHIGEGGVQFKTFDALLRGIEGFIEDGYLIRGKYRHIKKDGEWIFNFNDKFIYASDEGHPPVSGDQLAGICSGLSLAYHLHPERFRDSLKEKILLFTDRMIANKMMLQDYRTGKTCKGEIPYNSWREQNGSAVTKLALLSLAYKISSDIETGYAEDNKYFDWYWKLIDDYSFDSLAEYSSIFLGSWNNFFGTNIAALSLFAIGLNMDFPDYVKRGLKRIAWQTRDYGYGIFDLLAKASEDTAFYGSFEFKEEIKKRLYSHSISCGEDKFKRSIFFFGKKKRVSALSIRTRNKEDFVFQRNPFDPPNNFNPDLWALGNTGSEDFLLEYWLAKYLEVI